MQADAVPALQVPVPLQLPAGISRRELSQLAVPQDVPSIHLRHLPDPSHFPSFPQVFAAELGH